MPVCPHKAKNLIYESGEWQVDLERRQLKSRGVAVPIGARAFEIIEVLVQSASELVTKDELMQRVWPGAIVEENTLQVHIGAIRRALGQDRGMLKTASGRGYRLLGDWSVQRQTTAAPPIGLQHIRTSGETPGSNFPLTVTRLVGRSAAVRWVQDLVSAYRVVTLTGPGGIGKSSLAVKVGRRVLGEFGDGGWLVELASLSDPDLVPSTVAHVLGLKIGGQISGETVARAVGGRNLLLVLDNCEHVIDAVATLADMFVRHCPRTTLLATSRETLRIDGEHVYRVPPLDVPDDGQETPDHILSQSAVEFFMSRMHALDAGFSPHAEELTSVAAICRHLDGIPLAIEFAAARAATLGIGSAAAGLHDRFALLNSGRRTAVPRHRTLRATLDWSYQLLSEEECELLRSLAIFAGPFSLDAARAVVAEGVSEGEIANRIVDLVSKSLVFRTADPLTVEFRLLETTRAYAMDRLAESGALAAVAHRHAAYLLTVLVTVDAERRSRPRDQYLATFRRRSDEIHVALDWAFSMTGDRVVGVALTIAAVPLWFDLFQMLVARRRVEQALPHVEIGSDEEMRLRLTLGHAVWYTAPDSDALEPPFARALEIAESIGETRVRTQTLWGLWAAHRGRGDYPAALAFAGRYAEAASSTGDPGAIHLGDRILGLTHHVMGHQTLARGFAERALRQPHFFDAASGFGFQVETPVAMGALLARVMWLSGFPGQAIKAAAEAMAAAQKIGHPFTISYAVTLAGLPVALWTGDMAEARRQVDLLAANAGGIQRMERRVRAFTRVLRLRSGNEREALVASFIESHEDPAHLPPFVDLDVDADISVPLPGAEPVYPTWNTPEVLRVDAECLLWHGGRDANSAVEAKLLRALEIAREQSALSWELRCVMSLARLRVTQGRAGEAKRILVPVYDRFTDGFETADLRAARALLDDLPS